MQIEIPYDFVITRYTHFFKVTNMRGLIRPHMLKFMLKYTDHGFQRGENTEEAKKTVYGEVSADFSEYHFHIGQLTDFVNFAYSCVPGISFEIVNAPIPEPAKMRTLFKDEKYKLKAEKKQDEVYEFMLRNEQGDQHSRLATLPPGFGKTVIGLKSVCDIGHRTAILVIPTFQEKWRSDVFKYTHAQNKDLMYVEGGSAYLKGLIGLALEGKLTSDFIILSATTLTIFLDKYLEDPEKCREEYGCIPEELFGVLGVGTVLNDEAHMYLYAIFRILCHMNVMKLIALSGTYKSDNQVVTMIQRIIFPKEIRFQEVAPVKHTRAYGISYYIDKESMPKIRTTERGASMYSQSAYEKSILKNPKIRDRYFNLVGEVIENGMFDGYEKGDKAIVYSRTKAMCTALTDHFKKVYPDYDVRRYIDEDPYKNVIDADIRFTTNQSAGTGVDIENLTTNIALDNMNSTVAIEQSHGRLRELPNGRHTKYFNVYSLSVPKQVRYHQKKREVLADRVVSFKEFASRVSL